MTTKEREKVTEYLDLIEPAVVPATVPHAALILLRALLGAAHDAASHSPKRRGRRPKAAEAGGEGGAP